MLHHRVPLFFGMAVGISILSVAVAFGVKLYAEPTQPATTVSEEQPADPQAEAADQTTKTEQLIEKTDFTQKIVTVAPGATKTGIARSVAALGGEVVGQAGETAIVVKLPEDTLVEAEQALAANPQVGRVETDYAIGFASVTDWGVKRVKAPDVWSTTTGAGVRVAVLDTGIDANHADLAANYAGGYDFFNNDEDPQDDHGHGTAVAGIAGAVQNQFGTIGVGNQARVYGVKVLGSDGFGYISTLVAGIDWAIQNNMQVINMSLGTSFDSTTLKDAVDRAASRGIVVVASAGNTSGGTLVYPAAYDSVIAVGATDQQDQLASFSALGSELVAPGVAVAAPTLGGGHTSFSGTSASAPHVSGLAALLLAHGVPNPRQALRDGSVDLGAAGPDPYFGFGLPEAPRSLSLAEEDTESPSVVFVEPREGQRLAGQNVIRVTAQDDRQVVKVDLLINGKFYSSSATVPYRWRWDLQQTPPGVYELTARAIDEGGNIGQNTVRVEVITQASEERGLEEKADHITPQPTILPSVRPTSTTTSNQPASISQPATEESRPPVSAIEKIPPATEASGRPR